MGMIAIKCTRLSHAGSINVSLIVVVFFEGMMEIRRIKESDLNGFVMLWDDVFNEGMYLSCPSPPIAGIAAVLKKVVEQKIPHYVALVENEVIGCVQAFPADMCGLKVEGASRIGIVGAHIKLIMRGQGIARSLLTTLISDSKRFGYSKLILEVHEFNLPAKKLYQSFGFIYDGFGQDVLFPSGVKVRSERMFLLLT